MNLQCSAGWKAYANTNKFRIMVAFCNAPGRRAELGKEASGLRRGEAHQSSALMGIRQVLCLLANYFIFSTIVLIENNWNPSIFPQLSGVLAQQVKNREFWHEIIANFVVLCDSFPASHRLPNCLLAKLRATIVIIYSKIVCLLPHHRQHTSHHITLAVIE